MQLASICVPAHQTKIPWNVSNASRNITLIPVETLLKTRFTGRLHKVAARTLAVYIMTTSKGAASIRTSIESFTDILGPLRGDKISPNDSGEADKHTIAEREKRQTYSIHGEQVSLYLYV